jgi:glycosyltransferase involved in cell wall biosynthesis
MGSPAESQSRMRPPASRPQISSLSIVIPVHNGEGWIGRCLEHLAVAVDAAQLDDVDVVIVNDGSTDRTVAEAESFPGAASNISLRIVSQPMSGRFRARRLGLDQARHDFVLLIDVRVFIDPDALAFVIPRLAHSRTSVWTSHVRAATEDNPIAGFWQAIEHVAWRRYFRQPRTTSFGPEDFDYYPKGTTALIAPRDLLIGAFDNFEASVADWNKVNDDTAVLRYIVQQTPINISPHYRSTYNARNTLRAFLTHAEHRGTVLIDGYLRPGTRFLRPIQAVLMVSPLALWLALRHPLRALTLGAAGSAGAMVAARLLGARPSDARVLGVLAVPFGVAYLTGMWRGVFLRVESRRRVRPCRVRGRPEACGS